MPWTDFERKLADTRFEFTEEQLRTLKLSCANMYEILKLIFSAPRRHHRPFSSVSDYKFKLQRLYTSPSNFYTFTYKNVQIEIHFRFSRFYSVAVSGYRFPPLFFKEFPKRYHEIAFSSGFTYYGEFTRDDFDCVVDLFDRCVLYYLYRVRESREELPF